MSTEVIVSIVWGIAVLVQFRYWLLPQHETPPGSVNRVPVSVVVCVQRNVKDLQRLMQCLQGQLYPDFEVVVVNDGPDSAIREFLATMRWDKLRIIEFDASAKKVPGKKAPLAAGILAAAYAQILLTDADCTPGPQWIGTMVHHLGDDNGIVLGYAPFHEAPGLRNLLQRFDNLLIAVQYIGAAVRGHAYMGVGRNMLYHRSRFEAAGGFDSHRDMLSGDDDLFVQSVSGQARVSVCSDPASFVYSAAAPSWRDWFFQKRRHLSTARRYTRGARWRTTGFALSWLITWTYLPFVVIHGGWPLVVAFFAITSLWILFIREAIRLAQRPLILWYPVLAYCYCILIIVFSVLLLLPPPRTWTRS